MSVKCPECQATQAAPAAGTTSLCLGCGATLAGPPASAAGAPIRLKQPAATPAAAPASDDFTARTMSFARPDLKPTDSLESLSALVAEAQKEVTQTGRQAPSAPPPFAPQKAAAVWHVRQPDGAELGPASQDELLAWREQGKVDEQTMVWRAGFDRWLSLAEGLEHAGLARVPAAAVAPANGAGEGAGESFLSQGQHSADGFASGKTAIHRPSRNRGLPWQKIAAGVGVCALLGLAAVGAAKLIRGPGVAEVTSAAPAPVAPPSVPPTPAVVPAEPAPTKHLRRGAHARGAGHRGGHLRRHAAAPGAEPAAEQSGEASTPGEPPE